MKALEKAAQDRKGNDPAPIPAAKGTDNISKSELTLEPALTPQHKTATVPAAAPRDTQQAAAVIRAGQRAGGGGVGAIMRERPMVVIGALAILLVLGYGVYFYIQFSHPGLLIKSPPPLAQPLAVPAVTAPATGGTTASSTPPLLPLPLQGNEVPTPLAAGDKTVAATTTPTPEVPAPPPAPRDTIKVIVGGAAPTLNPLVTDAYQALQAGDLEAAQQHYDRLLQSDAANLDALLGLAAIAAKRGDSETAAKYYLRALELDPRNAAAQAGMLSLFGNADPLAAETRLKQLIAQNPSPFLYFALGNVYADQQRWPDAQQAYFQAHHLAPDNPDYAYNLAVGLDHIGQPKPALEFYRRAVQLAGTDGRANFNTAAAAERIDQLQKAAQ